MSGANHKPVTGYSAGFVKPDPIRDLAAYDGLPRPVRRALDDAPLAISAVAAADYYKTHGTMAVMREIRESADEFYAACEKQTGVPRPVASFREARRKRRELKVRGVMIIPEVTR